MSLFHRIFWGACTTLAITIVTWRLIGTVRGQLHTMRSLNRPSFRLAAAGGFSDSKLNRGPADQVGLHGEHQQSEPLPQKTGTSESCKQNDDVEAPDRGMATEHYAHVALGTTFLGPRKLVNEALPPPMTEIKSAELRVRSLRTVLFTLTLGFCSVAVGAAVFTVIPIIAVSKLYKAYEASRGSEVLQEMITMASECKVRQRSNVASSWAYPSRFLHSLCHHRLRLAGSLRECGAGLHWANQIFPSALVTHPTTQPLLLPLSARMHRRSRTRRTIRSCKWRCTTSRRARASSPASRSP